MTPQALSKYKNILRDMVDRIDGDTRRREENLVEILRAPGDLSNLPTHPADQDVEELDAELEVANVQDHLREQIRDALARIESGDYGTCQQCGVAIPKERLDAVPYTPFCKNCEEKVEQGLL